MPNIDRSVFEHLSKEVDGAFDAFVPIYDGHIEPLCAIYNKSCLPHFSECLKTGVLKMSEALEGLRVNFVDVGEGSGIDLALFRNINTPDDI